VVNAKIKKHCSHIKILKSSRIEPKIVKSSGIRVITTFWLKVFKKSKSKVEILILCDAGTDNITIKS
jgi:hypothetical protein